MREAKKEVAGSRCPPALAAHCCRSAAPMGPGPKGLREVCLCLGVLRQRFGSSASASAEPRKRRGPTNCSGNPARVRRSSIQAGPPPKLGGLGWIGHLARQPSSSPCDPSHSTMLGGLARRMGLGVPGGRAKHAHTHRQQDKLS